MTPAQTTIKLNYYGWVECTWLKLNMRTKWWSVKVSVVALAGDRYMYAGDISLPFSVNILLFQN